MSGDLQTTRREYPPRLEAWDRQVRPAIAIAALAPFIALAVIPDSLSRVFVIVDVASWLVFLVDYVVRIVLWRRYATTGNGIFDLTIVFFTFPWYILPVGANVRFLSVFRLARLVKLITSTSLMRRTVRLASRFGILGIWILGASLFSALVVLNAEPPSSGFDTFGDAIWWAVVSFTTVGYGDLYPTTGLGRFAGLIMMLTGLAALGSVAAILGSVFGDDAPNDTSDTTDVMSELQGLRDQVEELTHSIAQMQGSIEIGAEEENDE